MKANIRPNTILWKQGPLLLRLLACKLANRSARDVWNVISDTITMMR